MTTSLYGCLLLLLVSYKIAKRKILAMNLITCIVPMLFIEKVGRRLILLVSVFGAFVSLLLMGAGFLAISKNSAMTIPGPNNYLFNTSVKHYQKCMKIA